VRPSRVQDPHFSLPGSGILSVIVDDHFLRKSFASEDFSDLTQEIPRVVLHHNPLHVIQRPLAAAQDSNFRSLRIYLQ
jgi:hypothetical protein